MQRYNNSYYLSNTFLIVVYLVFRKIGKKPSDLMIPDDFLPESIASNREVQIMTLGAIAITIKYLKSPTWEVFFLNFFFFFKSSCITLLYFSDTWLMLWYLNMCFISWMLFKMPFTMHENKFSQFCSVTEFETEVLNKKTNWVFLFYSPVNNECIATNSLWCDLSVKYSTNGLKFAMVNIDQSRFLAQRCVVECDSYSRQLPCLVVYSEGKEVKRFPPVGKNGELSTVINYKVKEIIKYLGIDRLHLSTRDSSK